MVLGGWGASEKFAASMCFEFFIFRQEKRQKTTKIIFRLFNTCNSSPILLFCPGNPKSHFSWKIKKDARREMIEIRQIKSEFGQLWCHLVSNRIPVFEPKNQRIRVRVSSFRTAEAVPTPVGRKTEKLDFPPNKKNVAQYGDSSRFDETEWSGNILRIEIDPVLPTFCLTE